MGCLRVISGPATAKNARLALKRSSLCSSGSLHRRISALGSLVSANRCLANRRAESLLTALGD